MCSADLDRAALVHWLREEDPGRVEDLFRRADGVRRERVGDEVHLRGLVEVSSHCIRTCGYCGLRAPRAALPRYRMSTGEVLDCASRARGFGYGTVVLQAGEDPGLSRDLVADWVRRIRGGTGVAVTLSLGERSTEDLAAWKAAGADRYLLRFETSNPALLRRIHPPAAGARDRLAMLRELREEGWETGSGVMVGIPGSTWEDLAGDLLLFRELDLDMIGLGPWLCHPDTPLATAGDAQIPATEELTYRVLALSRLLCPDANIPATTALRLLSGGRGFTAGLRCGANVVMPNLTPPQYRRLYEIYPAKAAVRDDAETLHEEILAGIRAAGRSPGRGPGPAQSWQRRREGPGGTGGGEHV